MELTAALLASLLLPALTSAETVLGIYVFHRHGDRISKSTPPARLTSLGADQVYQSGVYFRSRYVATNATARINGVAADIAVNAQLNVVSPIDVVLQNSASVFLQGLYPPTTAAAETLANGSVAQAPLGGYQYIPVNSLTTAATPSAAEDTAWLQSGSGCDKAVVSSNGYFASKEYLDTLQSTRGFYQDLIPAINRTFAADAATFKNGYAIYDLINVAQIHNASYGGRDLITADVFYQLHTRANQHEWGLAFNASEPVRAIAGSVLAGQALQSLNASLTKPASSSRVNVQFGAYGTFMSFFGLAGLDKVSVNFTGIVEYASSAVFELVTNASVAGTVSPDDVSVRFRFANGSASDANPLAEVPLFGLGETTLPWATFAREMGKIAVADTQHWCQLCGSTTGACAPRQTGAVGTQDATDGGSGDGGVSRPVAGVIGALVTLVVILGIEGLVMAVVGLRVVKKTGAVAAAAEPVKA